MGSLMVRASDTGLEGLSSIPDATKYTRSTHSLNLWVRKSCERSQQKSRVQENIFLQSMPKLWRYELNRVPLRMDFTEINSRGKRGELLGRIDRQNSRFRTAKTTIIKFGLHASFVELESAKSALNESTTSCAKHRRMSERGETDSRSIGSSDKFRATAVRRNVVNHQTSVSNSECGPVCDLKTVAEVSKNGRCYPTTSIRSTKCHNPSSRTVPGNKCATPEDQYCQSTGFGAHSRRMNTNFETKCLQETQSRWPVCQKTSSLHSPHVCV
ncbi:transposable element Tc3 transposase [Trichonephila clavipes]|nr:transposable element Tc3 transposase [Trichonephila clavipes]